MEADLRLQIHVMHLSSSPEVEILDSRGRERFVRLRRDGEDNWTMALPHLRL
jgi:hypothetical protein